MKVLLVVDVQNDFVTGALANLEAHKRIPRIKEKIRQRLAEGWTVMFTQDTHYNSYDITMEGKYLPIRHCIEGSWGWQIVDELQEFESARPSKSIYKMRFGDYNLYNKISGRLPSTWNCHTDPIKEIELIGFCTDICIISNALILKSGVIGEDAIISCDASCCAGTTPEAHEAALRVMQSCQIEVINEGVVE